MANALLIGGNRGIGLELARVLAGDPDPERASRVIAAMLQMRKLDIAALEAAADAPATAPANAPTDAPATAPANAPTDAPTTQA